MYTAISVASLPLDVEAPAGASLLARPAGASAAPSLVSHLPLKPVLVSFIVTLLLLPDFVDNTVPSQFLVQTSWFTVLNSSGHRRFGLGSVGVGL